MTALSARIEGIGFWTRGLPSWEAARAFALGHADPVSTPARPSPQLLAPNERRRTPDTVAVALEVALAACQAAGRDPARLPSVFTSANGDQAITDYLCTVLASEPRAVSPTRFHNSVLNAAAGYWTIGTGAMRATTAITARDASFAQGLLEALTQLATGEDTVLLVGYDGEASGALGRAMPSGGLLGAALVLSRGDSGARLRAGLRSEPAGSADAAPPGPLQRFATGNAMAPMLPLFDALAAGHDRTMLTAGPDQTLWVELAHD